MTAAPMPADQFWQIIARAGQSGHDRDAHLEALRTALRELTLAEIISFEAAFRRYLNQAYTWDLWGAAYVIHGGCSDDGFEYFRRWLVSRGRDVYEAALADPDSLAQLDMQPHPDGVCEFEEQAENPGKRSTARSMPVVPPPDREVLGVIASSRAPRRPCARHRGKSAPAGSRSGFSV